MKNRPTTEKEKTPWSPGPEFFENSIKPMITLSDQAYGASNGGRDGDEMESDLGELKNKSFTDLLIWIEAGEFEVAAALLSKFLKRLQQDVVPDDSEGNLLWSIKAAIKQDQDSRIFGEAPRALKDELLAQNQADSLQKTPWAVSVDKVADRVLEAWQWWERLKTRGIYPLFAIFGHDEIHQEMNHEQFNKTQTHQESSLIHFAVTFSKVPLLIVTLLSMRRRLRAKMDRGDSESIEDALMLIRQIKKADHLLGLSLVHHTDKNGQNAIHHAVMLTDICYMESKKGAFRFRLGSKSKKAHEHAMLITDHSVKVLEELHHMGIEINHPDHEGQTPLLCAARHLNEAATEFLIHHGARSTHVNLWGQTALHEWCQVRPRETALEAIEKDWVVQGIRTLLRHGVPLDAKNKEGLVAFDLLKQSSWMDWHAYRPEFKKMDEQLCLLRVEHEHQELDKISKSQMPTRQWEEPIEAGSSRRRL